MTPRTAGSGAAPDIERYMPQALPDSILLPPSELIPDAVLDVNALYPRRQPLAVDLGCGKGRFLLARAAQFPATNFLGIDRMRKRLHKVERKVQRAGLTNVRLLQLEASYLFTYLLPPRSVAICYIFFPDPWPKRRHHRRRLFSEDFITVLHQCLIDHGEVHVATDHPEYFEAIYKILRTDSRFRQIDTFVPAPDEQTHFEIIFLGQDKQIGRCSFVKNGGEV